MTKWARIKTSQWHLLHSLRVGSASRFVDGQRISVPYEFILTQDGYELPTETYSNWYGAYSGKDVKMVPTGAKTWEGEGLPKGRICARCSAFMSHQKNSVEIEFAS